MSDRFDGNLGYWCRAPVEERPSSVALIDLSREPAREVTYVELDDRMNRVASLLVGCGVEPGHRVAMAIGNRFEFVEIMFGAMRAGAVPVPLNTKLGAETMEYIVRDADCRAAFVEPSCNPFARSVMEGAAIQTRISLEPIETDWLGYEDAMGESERIFDPPPLPDDHPAFQPYTSGSTGKPKGVVLTHEGQLWWIRAVQRYWPSSPDDRGLVAVPLYHKNAMAGAIKPLLHSGGSVVLLPDFESRRFLRALSDYRCTQTGGVPAVFVRLLNEVDLIDDLDFSSLRGISIGSAPVPAALMSAVESAFGVSVKESYGLTEGGPVMIGSPLDGRETPVGSCGVAWPEGDVKLVDESGEESTTHGELWVRNPGVTPGFHGLPAVNRERLKDGWLATGDIFEKDEGGFFYFKGRTDDMFNCGGENVYPKEVENLLLSHNAVSDAAVVPLPHAVKGHVPVAMVALFEGTAASAESLKQFCIEHGPAYAHPRRVLIADELPLSGVGKPDRNAIAARLEEAYGPDLTS